MEKQKYNQLLEQLDYKRRLFEQHALSAKEMYNRMAELLQRKEENDIFLVEKEFELLEEEIKKWLEKIEKRG